MEDKTLEKAVEIVKTKRSHAQETRNAETRAASQREIDYYRRLFERDNIAKTYIDESLIPEGFVVMWARGYVNGVRDETNLNELRRRGWEIVTCDSELGRRLGSVDTGAYVENDEIVNNELILLIRPKWIHQMEVERNIENVRRKDINNFVQGDSRFSGLQASSFKSGMENTRNKSEYFSSNKAKEMSSFV